VIQMSNKKQKTEFWTSIILIVAVICVWGLVLLIEFQPFGEPGYTSDEHPITQDTYFHIEDCAIEYGYSECINKSIVTSFYNPGIKDVTKVSMYFREGDDVDIYNCKEPLGPGSPSTLTTISCTEDVNMSDVWLVWCCGDDCHDTYMAEPSEDLTLVY